MVEWKKDNKQCLLDLLDTPSPRTVKAMVK